MSKYHLKNSNGIFSACARLGRLFFLPVTLFCIHLTVIPSLAENPERKLDGTVKSGSAGNAFTVTVTNPNSKYPIENLALKAVSTLKWINNIQIKADNSGPLPAGATRKYTVLFDVDKAAEADAIETVIFQVSADGVIIDTPNPEMTVKIEKAVEKDGTSLAPVLKLIKIQGPETGRQTPGYSEHYNVDYREGETGFSAATNYRYSHPDWIQALRITSAPLEIILGEPFEMTAEIRKKKIHEPGEMCFPRKGDAILYSARVGYKEEKDRTLQSPQMRMEPGNARVIGKDDLHVYCRSNDTTKPEGRVLDALVEKEGSVKLRVIYTPERVEMPYGADRPRRKYHYRLDFVTDGNLQGYVGQSEVSKRHVIDFNKKTNKHGFLHPEEEPRQSVNFSPLKLSASFSISSISLYYDAIHDGEPHITSLPEYPWPPDLTRPPRDERGGGGDGSAEGEGDGPGGPGTGTGTVSGGPVDPNRLNPKEEKVSTRIREWISVAEPPENATEGARFRYDQWGRKIGTTAGGATITAASRPDYAMSTPEETVWSMRTKLDSVNHCTLEEYVVAKLANRSLASCQGRYKASATVKIEKLTGLPLAEAKKKLKKAGLKPKLVAGKPAPTKQKEGTIASQVPAPNAKLKRGDSVKLEIYGPYVSKTLILPGLVGLSVKKAKARLKAKGLETRLVSAGPAPSKDQAFKVKETNPRPGAKVRPGAKITLRVYSKYSAPFVTVPKVAGMSYTQAKKFLERVGLKASPKSAGPAPSQGKSSRIKSQQPAPGAKVKPGDPVKVYVFSKYVPPPIGRRDQFNDCPCVDERGRRYRVAFGMDCNQEYSFRDYNCSGGGGGDNRRRQTYPCDLVGRWKHNSDIMEFTKSGSEYIGRIIQIRSSFGYRPGDIKYKVRKINQGRYEGVWFNRDSRGKGKWKSFYIVEEKDPMLLKCTRMRFHIAPEYNISILFDRILNQ